MTLSEYYTLKPGDQVADSHGRYWTVTQAATATARAKAERSAMYDRGYMMERCDVGQNWTKLPKLDDDTLE